MGAGILPISIYNGKLMFLFSREAPQQGKAAGLWSDFGGGTEKIKGKRETPFQTAIREGWEESNGILGNKKDVSNLLRKHLIREIVLNDNKGKYTTYLVLVDYNKHIIKRFSNDFKQMKKKNPKLLSEHNGLYEKDKIKWISYNTLKNHMTIFRPFYKPIIKKIISNFNHNSNF